MDKNSVMQSAELFAVFDQNGSRHDVAGVEAALAKARSMIYADERSWERARELLQQGEAATVVYGFASIQIWPAR